jgi:hypothetical protein
MQSKFAAAHWLRPPQGRLLMLLRGQRVCKPMREGEGVIWCAVTVGIEMQFEEVVYAAYLLARSSHDREYSKKSVMHMK